jgi:hypothetical protein
MPFVSQPLCEACWIVEKGETLIGEDGDPVLCHVPQPTRAMFSGLEECCECGNPTISGIYVKKDLLKVRFPSIDDGDEEPVRHGLVNA